MICTMCKDGMTEGWACRFCYGTMLLSVGLHRVGTGVYEVAGGKNEVVITATNGDGERMVIFVSGRMISALRHDCLVADMENDEIDAVNRAENLVRFGSLGHWIGSRSIPAPPPPPPQSTEQPDP